MRYRVGLDARVVKPAKGGLGRYASELVLELTAMDLPDIQWEIIKLPVMADVRLAAPGADVPEHLVDGEPDLTANVWRGAAIDALGLDLYHSLHHFLPARLRCSRVVMTLHDLMWVDHAHLAYYGWQGRLRGVGLQVWGSATMKHALRRADAVVCNSEATRAAALARYPFLDEESISATQLAVRRTRFPRRSGPEQPEPYFFCLGNTRPYKNIRNVFRGFAQLVTSLPDSPVRLAVAGRGDNRRLLEAFATDLGVAERVDFLGMVDDAEIIERYHGALGLAFPSRIEGFGLPVLEAMHAGCPVIVSQIPVFREIVGEAGLYVSPESPESIAAAMRRLMVEPYLRPALRERGYARAERFSWERCATETLAVYRRLLAP